ncbi:MAG TPA: imidazoleglycerol-phosphate dehydratase HisB [Candidatus Brocadiia bacterium]|nr:imidazoleglycerol-phosphate dehydratase HisB [Candidatus Brocadiia bacterium]
MSEAKRQARQSRMTKETEIDVSLRLDGPAGAEAETGVGFFDHMLQLLAHHSGIGLIIKARGDLHVDAHHTVEDVGIVLGKTMREALGDMKGFRRFGWAIVPMQESLAQVSLDICGRPHLSFNTPSLPDKVGDFDTELVEEFLLALCNNLGMTLHVDVLRGQNAHHVIEAVFKALAKALEQALERREGEAPSTKGCL